jgi:hypothetical protein
MEAGNSLLDDEIRLGKKVFGFRRVGDWCCMKDDQHRFMSILGQLPARLTAEETGWLLNCQPHDIPALVAARLLKPLGNPAPNGIKFFCTADLLDSSKDRSWLAKMTNTINQHWHGQNSRRTTHSMNGHGSQNGEQPFAGRGIGSNNQISRGRCP